MIDFAEARRRVQIHLAAKWKPEAGTLTTLPEGYQDATAYCVVAGAREALVDGDPDYAIMDAPALLVDKRTGEVQELPVIPNLNRLDAMTPTEG